MQERERLEVELRERERKLKEQERIRDQQMQKERERERQREQEIREREREKAAQQVSAPKKKVEQRISTMTEAQVMEKLSKLKRGRKGRREIGREFIL
jgi:protein-serine/threonine kinase